MRRKRLHYLPAPFREENIGAGNQYRKTLNIKSLQICNFIYQCGHENCELRLEMISKPSLFKLPAAKFWVAASLLLAGAQMASADSLTPSSPGWQLVRHADNVGGWHPTNDNLAGTAVYGTVGTETSAGDFSINFESAVAGWDQVLFMFGDRSKWMIMDRSQLTLSVANQPLQILASYFSATPYTALMYNRPSLAEDPWLSAIDHGPAIFSGDILYGENSFGSLHFSAGPGSHLGANVFVRNSGAAAAVPESAATFALLGGALLVCVWRRRR